MRKVELLQIRLTEREKEQIKSRASNVHQSMSRYLNCQGINGQVIDPVYLNRIYVELSRIGNNINQMARIANTYHNLDGRDYQDLYHEVMKIKKLFEGIK